MPAVAVVSGGGRNINSVLFALERLNVTPLLTTEAAAIAAADRVILMGVGAAGPGMEKLRRLGLVDCFRRLEQPLLGICVGMQLLYERSAEGEVECLGILPGRIERFREQPDLAVPQMGWNRIEVRQPDNPLLAGMQNGDQAYYANSYYAPASDLAIATSDYGVNLAAVVNRGNVYGCQFHPEKSRRVGQRILENFLTRT
jgi:imidazole glycerol-phosphate synthase subunit HisH